MKKIQSGDSVIVTAGKRKGTKSVVLKVVQKKDERRGDRVVVKGVNIVKKAKRGEGYKEFEAPIHGSNVMHWDEGSSSASRVRFDVKNGKKVRLYTTSGKEIIKAA